MSRQVSVHSRGEARVWIERQRSYDFERGGWRTEYSVNWRVPGVDAFAQCEGGFKRLIAAGERAQIVRMLLAVEAPVVVDPMIE